jgi:DNA-binding NarL/FixJ family response regulator
MAMKKDEKQTENKTKVLIVDDHPIVRQGISRIVNSQPDMVVCAEAFDMNSTMQAVEQTSPNVIVMDISLKDVDGLRITKDLRSKGYTMPILILSMHDESIYAQKAIRSGANGYVTKDESSEKLVLGIRSLLEGNMFVSDDIKKDIVASLAEPNKPREAFVIDKLSDRERQIFLLIGKGYSTRKISATLAISPKTIDSHRSRIKLKLDINDGQKLVLAAVAWMNREGLVPPQI